MAYSKRFCSRLFFTILVCAVAFAGPAYAQMVSGALSLEGSFGPGFYIGEFNSLTDGGAFNPTAGYDLGFGLKYNVAKSFTLAATVGWMNLSYNVNDYVRQKYASNFFGPVGATDYPGSTVAITSKNYMKISRYILFAQSHFTPSSKWDPYFTLGIGFIDFRATNANNVDLPTNITGTYSKSTIVMPLGLGIQYTIGDRFAAHAQGLFYINSTDYLDGYAHFLDFETNPGGIGPGNAPTPPDYMMSLMFGLTYTLYKPEPKSEEPEPLSDLKNPPKPLDSDGDGLSDSDEVNRYKTNPHDPDTDHDNLNDFDEVRKYNTSPNNPDTDGDSLKDGEEVMIYHTNPLNPDTDGDGVPDGQDQCPLVPGPASNHGCPLSNGARTEIDSTDNMEVHPRAEFGGIYFRNNTDDFDFTRPETARNLGNLLTYMQQCEDMRVVIEGHTSSEGNPARNQRLSELRAQRVRNWLLANGVEPNKLLGAVGYGSKLPKVAEPSPGSVSAQQLEDARSANRRITALVRRPCE